MIGDKFSKKGFKGSAYEEAAKNTSNNKYKELFYEVQKDITNHVVKK
jgi:hypothetical protein